MEIVEGQSKGNEKEKDVVGPWLGTSQNTKKVVLGQDTRLTDLPGTMVMAPLA
jgi:hypothetical protein